MRGYPVSWQLNNDVKVDIPWLLEHLELIEIRWTAARGLQRCDLCEEPIPEGALMATVGRWIPVNAGGLEIRPAKRWQRHARLCAGCGEELERMTEGIEP